MELKKLPIDFLPEEHVYVMQETGQMLKGITGTLIHRLFPNKYDGVPEFVLKKAAEHGTKVHEDIEAAETLEIAPETQEGKNFMRLKAERGWVHLSSEYLVSDMLHYATKIDEVLENEDGTVDLIDFKTTRELDEESLSWQLSICAKFFEQNNPGIKVRNLYGIWLKGDVSKAVQVKRQADEDIEKLIADDLAGVEIEVKVKEAPGYIVEREASLIYLEEQIRELTAEKDRIKQEIMEKMTADGLKSADTGSLLVTYVEPGVRKTFDQARFKDEHGELWGEYMKETVTKASLKITYRDF